MKYFLIRERLEKHIYRTIPGFKIKNKKQSLLMKILGRLLFFNPQFMSRYVSVIYPVMYVPDFPFKANDHVSATELLAHEYVHLRDRKSMGPLFNFLYLSPQILAVFGFLGFSYSPWFMLFFLFALPWPSPGRAWLEYRGYRMSLAVMYWLRPSLHIDSAIDFVTYQFTSSNYFWMMPFKGHVRRLFYREFNKIRNNKLTPELEEIKVVLGV